MFFSFLFLFLCFAVFNVSLGSFLDLAELSSVLYNIKMDKIPVVENVLQSSSQPYSSIYMVNLKGQKYSCSLPQPPPEPDSVTASNKPGEAIEKDIATLLSPLENAPCIFYTKDWWTYEVCYMRDVKQYRVEGETPVGAVMVLGVHNPMLDTWGESNKTYQSHWYDEGSRCDLTGEGRKTELRFVCNDMAVMEFIGDIFEPQSCEYRIVIHTDKLCGLSWLKPVSVKTPLPIVCQPVLSQFEMEQYQLFQEKTKLSKQLMQQQRKQKQSLKLVKQLGPRERIRGAALGFGTVDSMMEVMGDKMSEKILGEVNTLIDKSLVTMGGSVAPKNGKKTPSSKKSSKVHELDDKTLTLNDGSGLQIYESSIKDLIFQRNVLWDRMMEARKTLGLYKDELKATESRIFTLNSSEENQKNMKSLEVQWRSLEVTLANIQVNIAKMESKAKSFTRRIFFMKDELKMKNSLEISSNKIIKSGVIKNDKNMSKKPTFLDLLKIKEDQKFEVPNEDSFMETKDENRVVAENTKYPPATIEENLESEESDLFGGNIKFIVQKQSSSDDINDRFDQAQAEKVVVKLEEVIKEAMSEHGIAEGGKIVEVKLITTNLPDGLENEDMQLQNMLYTMMTGNVQGFEDIDNIRRDEENYNYVWKEEMMEEINEKIQSLREEGFDQDLVDQMVNYAVEQDEEIKNYWENIRGRKNKSYKTTKHNIDESVKKIADKMVNDIVEGKGIEKNQGEVKSIERKSKDKNLVTEKYETYDQIEEKSEVKVQVQEKSVEKDQVEGKSKDNGLVEGKSKETEKVEWKSSENDQVQEKSELNNIVDVEEKSLKKDAI